MKKLNPNKREYFEKFLEFGNIKQPLNISIRRNMLGGVILAIVLSIMFYKEGSMIYFGSFSLIAVAKLSIISLILFTTIALIANIISAVPLYLLLYKDPKVDMKRVIAANMIGGNHPYTAQSHLLLKEVLKTNKRKTDLGLVIGMLLYFMILGLIILPFLV